MWCTTDLDHVISTSGSLTAGMRTIKAVVTFIMTGDAERHREKDEPTMAEMKYAGSLGFYDLNVSDM
jgi:hypothetical protein